MNLFVMQLQSFALEEPKPKMGALSSFAKLQQDFAAECFKDAPMRRLTTGSSEFSLLTGVTCNLIACAWLLRVTLNELGRSSTELVRFLVLS